MSADAKAQIDNLKSQVAGLTSVDASVRALIRGVVTHLQGHNQNPSLLQAYVAELQLAEAELTAAIMVNAVKAAPPTAPDSKYPHSSDPHQRSGYDPDKR